MLINIIIFFLVIFTLVILLQKSGKFKEGFVNSSGIPVASHQSYTETSKQKFNELTNLVNLTDPSVSIQPSTQVEFNNALQTVSITPSSGALNITGLENNKNVPTDLPSNYKLATLCESKSNDCSAFDDPTFASNCGVSFDPKGTSYNGKPHIGGMFISPSDRQQQMQQMADLDTAGQDGYMAFKPSLGSVKPGSFSLTKDQCVVVKERIECKHKQSFNSPNCTQCYTSGNFNRVDPSTPRLPSTLYLFGNGSVSVSSQNPALSLVQTALSPQNAIQVTIPPDGEGTRFVINVSPNASSSPNGGSGRSATYVLGYISGETPRGVFKLDLMSLIDSDQVSSAKPKISGANMVNGFRSFVIIPATGKTNMALSGLIPFSFLSLYDGDARTCDNGPIITQATSATFLESDPCFNRKNKPGSYSLSCLQTRWIELGGTQQGTGYPNNKQKADDIQLDSNGNPLDIDTIVNILYPKMIQAFTGQNPDGSPLTVPEWNSLSIWATGTPISTPCDGPSGNISQECLQYLYMNQGAQSHIGATYTLPSMESSLKGSINGSNIYCQPGAPLDPSTSTGKQFISGIVPNGINAIKSAYDRVHRTANDNTLSNQDRKEAINQCYGVTLDSVY